MLTHNNAFTSAPLVHSSVMGGKLLTLPIFSLHFKSKSTQLSLARFEPGQILIHNNVFTSVPLVHSCVKVGKILTLPNFLLYPIFYFISSQKAHKCLQRDLNETKLLHFKSKSAQMSSAGFESDQMGKLLTLANFLLHFKAKSTQLSLARFEPDELLKHNNSFTPLPLVHSCVKVGKLLTLANFLLYPIFYFISSQKAHNSLQRDLNETKLLHFKSKSTQMSSARFKSDQILIHNKAVTSVPLVYSRVVGSKLLKLPNFLLHFKS